MLPAYLGRDMVGRANKFVNVACSGRIRRHGTSRSGLPKFEACLDNDCPTTPIIKEAAGRGDILYAEVLLDGGGIQVHTKPYIDRGLLCMNLHLKYAPIWERLWKEGKPVLIMFVIRW